MGGCKCTFYNCGLTTKTAKKLYPERETHFFHFPIRDLERCVEWAVYSNNMDFLNLSPNKILNKVVCDFHFKENNFMNYKRERLTKTSSVPTIYIPPVDPNDPESMTEIDLVTNPTDWVIANQAKAVPPSFQKSSKINIDESSFDDQEEFEVTSSPVIKRPKIEIASLPAANKPKVLQIRAIPTSPSVRILNGKATSSGAVSLQKLVKKLPTATENLPSPKSENYTIRTLPISVAPKVIKQEFLQVPKIGKQDILSEPILEEEIFQESPISTVEVFTTPDVPTLPHPQTPTTSRDETISEDLKSVLMDSLKQIGEVKELLNKTQAKESAPKELDDSPGISQSQLNKVQLFNGIKRYLSPSMIALLRLELFATAGREYKKDEKIICKELLQLGEETYSFMTDEWRLRLPAKTDVQKWLNEQNSEEDDDAS